MLGPKILARRRADGSFARRLLSRSEGRMDLPLLLAGPILRRVEPTVAAVWIALSKAATVRLLVWEGSAPAGVDHDNPFVQSSATGEQTWRLGDQVHLGLLTARIPEASGKAFLADQL
jgi:hypothetical protein